MRRSLVFDGQVFQTPAWHRGMGKYSMELISALHDLNSSEKFWDNIYVIFSSKLKTEELVTTSLRARAPSVVISYLELSPNEYDNRPVANRNRQVIDEYFQNLLDQEELNEMDYIVLSLLQSETAPAFSSIKKVNNYLLFYDLIPLMFYKTYLQDGLNRKSYLTKLSELMKADAYLAISKTVANDLSITLGIDTKRIISVDGAPIEHGDYSEEIDVPSHFILMPTGNDLRKNNRRGIEGFQLFNQKNDEKYSLVVTSSFAEHEIADYKSICPKIIFTGNIKGEQLEYLYQNTDTLLFPTEYEGLGLPILEALEKNKPVACSDISVFREMSDTAFHYFDPSNPMEIADALQGAVGSKIPTPEYKRVIKKYSWPRTAKLFLEFAKKEKANTNRPISDRASVFSPSPDESAYGDELQQMYSELQRSVDVSYFFDQSARPVTKGINYLAYITNSKSIFNPSTIPIGEGALPVYFIEDAAYCSTILMVSLANPGVAILRDRSLKKLWETTVDRRLIDSSRIDAERKLGELYGDNNYLVSILASQKLVAVRDKQFAELLQLLVSKFPKKYQPKIVTLPTWHAKLVYEKLNPDYSSVDYPSNAKIGESSSEGQNYLLYLLKQHKMLKESK